MLMFTALLSLIKIFNSTYSHALQNSPLYLRTVADPMDAELSHKLMYMLHTSLDVVEEKINSPVPGK